MSAYLDAVTRLIRDNRMFRIMMHSDVTYR